MMAKKKNNKKKKPLLSIIIPIYNAQKNLRRCLNSIHEMENENIEVVLVDDGSVDNSVLICKEFIEKDGRFCLYRKINGGVSSARNYGMKQAVAEYIYFMDSDDYICSKKMSNVIKCLNNDVDIVCFNYVRDDREKIIDDVRYKRVDRIELIHNLKDESFKNDFGYVWNKIYKKEIIQSKNISFEEKIAEREDFLFNIECFGNAHKIIFCEDYIYHYIQYESSLSKSRRNKEFVGDFINLLEVKLKKNYLQNAININDVVLEMLADYIVKSIFGSFNKYKEMKNEIMELAGYNHYVYNSRPHNLYLKIFKNCFNNKNLYPFYCYYKLSNLKKKYIN